MKNDWFQNIEIIVTLENTSVPLEVTSKELLRPVFEVTSQSGTLLKIAFLSEFAREAYPHPPQYSIWIANFILNIQKLMYKTFRFSSNFLYERYEKYRYIFKKNIMREAILYQCYKDKTLVGVNLDRKTLDLVDLYSFGESSGNFLI